MNTEIKETDPAFKNLKFSFGNSISLSTAILFLVSKRKICQDVRSKT